MLAEEAEKQWQALRYAVDQIDIAWSLEFQYLTEAERESKRNEMKAHREVLLEMQNKALKEKRFWER